MKKFIKCLTWVLVLSICFGIVGAPVFATDTNMRYFFNPTVASDTNDLFAYNGDIVTQPLDPATLDETRGTHYYAGNGNFSRYSSAHLTRYTEVAGEEPVAYGSDGTPYYVNAAHTTMENRKLYVDDYYMDGQHIEEKCYARYDYIQTFVLADSRTGQLTTAYCADQLTAAVKDEYYNIQNLEDAVYYTSDQAKKVRTIVLNGYWGQTSGLGSLDAMEDMLRASGEFTEDELANLSDGVAMTATQYAIWHYTNNATGDKRISAYYTTNSGSCGRVTTAEQKADVDLIFKIYHYLIELDPSSVENTTAHAVINKSNLVTSLYAENAVLLEEHPNNADNNEDNDAYSVDVTFTMGVRPRSDNSDDLVAYLIDENGNELAKGRISGTPLTGETMLIGGSGTYSFEDVVMTEDTAKTLRIKVKGYQHLEQGVYLFTHENGYEASQTLVSIAEGTHAVDVVMDWPLNFNEKIERVISINKTTPEPENRPLPGIQFDFYFLAGRNEYLSGEVTLPEKAADYNGELGSAAFTITTDENGQGTYNLTENNKPDGVYLVKERSHPAIVAPVDPFYVVIPDTNKEGDKLVYRIEINPKNEVRGDVEIEKDVIELGNNLSNQNAYDSHLWIISTTIPADIGIGKEFRISDTLDNRLDFLGNVRVTVENANGTTVAATLEKDTHYTLTVSDVDSLVANEEETKPSDSFIISLTKAGMEKVADATTDGITHIRVYFDAQINANAQMGELIPNKATLYYKNSLGFEFNPESDIPEVYTGGARLKKVDGNNETVALAGAEFKLYRTATAEEEPDANIKVGENTVPVVAVEFFATPNLTGTKTNTTTSDANGFVYFYGLVDSTETRKYYAVETKAPDGYNLAAAPIVVTINQNSHKDENIIKVLNFSGTVLPNTGGMGTEVFTVSGLMLAMTAAVLLLQKKRKFI